MTGICGIKTPKSNYDKKDINRMLKCLSHRGNKYKEIYQDESVIIGIQGNTKDRINECKNHKMFVDGVIYNKRDLIDELNIGISNKTNDPEFLSLLYEKYGSNIFEKLNGDFICIKWEPEVDELGFTKYLTNNKNIFYRKKGNTLFFSSEMKSILNLPFFKNKIDYKSVSDFITFGHIPFPNTLFSNIKRIPPLSFVKYNNGEFQTEKLNFFHVNSEKKMKDINNIIKKMEFYFDNAIRKRLNICNNFGLYLSGGIDSSTILYFLDKYSKKPVNTYTVALSDDGPYAKRVSNYFNTNHLEKKLEGQELINVVPKALWHLEYPQDHAGIFQYFLPKISKNERIIFWGQGGEEAVFGRKDYVALNVIKNIKNFFPNSLKKNSKQ
ncbi:MAG: asparagine synthase-related protein [Candidatus Aenigmatarchaeota archaeon]